MADEELEFPDSQEQMERSDRRIEYLAARSDTAPEDSKPKKRSFAPMRIGILVLIGMCIVAGMYLVYRGISKLTSRNSITPTAVMQPRSSLVYGAQVVPQLSPGPVQSLNNTREITGSPSSGQVLGATTDSTGYSTAQKNQDNSVYRCPDALGDTYACLPSWYKP